jgi:hypothetical protein
MSAGSIMIVMAELNLCRFAGPLGSLSAPLAVAARLVFDACPDGLHVFGHGQTSL